MGREEDGDEGSVWEVGEMRMREERDIGRKRLMSEEVK